MSVSIRAALREWLQVAISYLDVRPVPSFYDWKLTVDETGGYQASAEEAADIYALVHGSASVLLELPETSAAISAIQGDQTALDAFKGFVSSDDQIFHASQIFSNCLLPLAVSVLSPKDATATIEDRFQEVYEQLREFVYRFDQMPFRWIIHLNGITMEMEEVSLCDKVRLRRATRAEQERAFSASRGYSQQPWVEMRGVKRMPSQLGENSVPLVVVEILDKHTLPRRPPFFDPARRIGERVIESLGLVDEGEVAAHSIWIDDSSVFANWNVQPELFDHTSTKWIPYPGYALTAEKADLLRQLYPVVQLPREAGSLSLARQRLLYSYDRKFVADPILDCWIGLESLFLPDGSAELWYRAALRIARYLGSTPDERLEIFRTVKKSYDARSALAHGNVRAMNKLDERMVLMTRSLLRRAIRKALLEGRTPDVDSIHEALLS